MVTEDDPTSENLDVYDTKTGWWHPVLGDLEVPDQVSGPQNLQPVDDAGEARPTTAKAQVCDLGFHMVAGARTAP